MLFSNLKQNSKYKLPYGKECSPGGINLATDQDQSAMSGLQSSALATALTAGMTVQQIVDLDLSYAPPFSPIWDPVQTAARQLVG